MAVNVGVGMVFHANFLFYGGWVFLGFSKKKIDVFFCFCFCTGLLWMEA